MSRVVKKVGIKKVGLTANTRHITPVGGNVFADLGFKPDDAARMKLESDIIISEKLRRKMDGGS